MNFNTTIFATLLALASTLASSYSAFGQGITITEGTSILPGQVTIGEVPKNAQAGVFTSVEAGPFTSTLATPVKKGDVLPGRYVIGHGTSSVWSDRAQAFSIGGRIIHYPAVGILKGLTVFACTTIIKTAAADKELRTGGYVLQAGRDLKERDEFPSLLISGPSGYSIVSIESRASPKDEKANLQPLLAIFDEQLKLDERDGVVQAWRLTAEIVRALQ
jgi:hypothetical protein